MGAVRRLCNKGVLLVNGEVYYEGNTIPAIDKYMSKSLSRGKNRHLVAYHDQDFYFTKIYLLQENKPVEVVHNGLVTELKIEFTVIKKIHNLRIFFDLFDCDHNLLFRSLIDEGFLGGISLVPGEYICKAVIPKDVLVPTSYMALVQAVI